MGLPVRPVSFYGPFKDGWLYLKHRRRHVIDLDDNFKTLSLKHGSLLASKTYIERTLKFKKENDKYRELWDRIQDITRKYEKIESKFKKYRGAHSPSAPRNINVASGGEASTSSAQVVQNEQIGQRKIWTRNFFNNARLDKDVLKLIGEIDGLKIEDVKLETLVTKEIYVQRKNAPEGDCAPLWLYVQKILDYLKSESTKRIGICGDAQVGKSTVLKMLNNFLLSGISSSSISLQYDVVIWVNFPSKDSGDVKEKMQQEILKSIHENDEQSLGHNAAKINEALVKRKYLLILDDVYEQIDLADLGIHDNHELGKIVIGATGEGVLKRMKVDERILIENLGPGDAEKFFMESLGVEPSGDLSTIQPFIKKIIELLDGHIGALVGIADYIKGLGNDNKKSTVWDAIVRDLQSPNSPKNLELGALEKAYKLRYDGLKDNNLRKCLLYVALFPVGYHAHTSYLVECWKAEKFLHGYHTYKEARHRGILVFSKLTESRLLEKSGEKYLKMPLLFRKVALQIPYPDEEDNNLMVRDISETHNHPCDEDWDTAKRISLMCGKLKFLPDEPKCSKILTLLLQANLELMEIKDKFFENMVKLQVLDLQRTGINGLPNSIVKLGCLKCLYLNDCCSLKSLPTEISSLNQLELLDIRRTSMRCLPNEIWNLRTLRCLRISVYSLAAGGTEDPSKEIAVPQHEPLPCFSPGFKKLIFLEELTVHVDPQTPDRGLIVDQIKKALEEVDKDLEVKLEPEESYLHSSNNVVANDSGLNKSIALTGSQSNGQDTTLPHSSSPITKAPTINKLNHVNKLENTDGSTSTANSQHNESTKEWVEKRFQGK